MFNWLRPKLRNLFYGKPITKNYLGKVVRVDWVDWRGNGEGGSYLLSSSTLIVVVEDDGSRKIAGSIIETDGLPSYFLSSRDGLHHASKRSVTVVASSVAEYEEAKQVKLTREKSRKSVCSNEAKEVGIVTDYDGTTFYGKTLEGNLWESKAPKFLALTCKDYLARRVM